MAEPKTKTIRTEAGTLELVPATIDQLRDIASYWPMELLTYQQGSPDFGLVFQHGNEEVFGVKMQFPDMPEIDAQVLHGLHRTWIASALPCYIEKCHQGVMVPCAYLKEKSPGMAEAGLAFFVGPGPRDTPLKGNGGESFWDDKLGAGATRMVWDMVHSLGEPKAAAEREMSGPASMELRVIGMELRPRLQIGGLAMHFVIVGENIFVVKYPLNEEEPVWRFVVRAGLRRLPYASMVPAGLVGASHADFEHT